MKAIGALIVGGIGLMALSTGVADAQLERLLKDLPSFPSGVGGTGISDSQIEARLKESHPLIAEACVVADGRPYVVALITLDADGQHYPEQVLSLYYANMERSWDVLIGSRYAKTHDYSQAPLGRRIGMRLFSLLVWAITGHHIYDTTSGLKVIRRSVFEVLTHWHFIDFHAEAIVYLLQLGYSVSESPISVAERTQGRSMYSLLSHLTYPLQTSLILLLGVVEAGLTRRKHL